MTAIDAPAEQVITVQVFDDENDQQLGEDFTVALVNELSQPTQ